ncbi:MAG: helix-turn-helix domain-containing protein [Planktomarina sp.]
MTDIADLKTEWMNDPEFKVEYKALDAEFTLARQLITARTEAGLTQEQVAKRMGTRQSEVSRIEAARQNISIAKLQSYADAVGAKLDIKLRSV